MQSVVLPHLSRGRRGPAPTLSLHKIFNYILQILYMGKFRRLLLRFERISELHYAFKTLACTMINLRHYYRS